VTAEEVVLAGGDVVGYDADVYPGMIMANGARMEGIDASLFFTFFGLDAICKDHQDKIKVATVGNPGMHIPTLMGGLPGISARAIPMMRRRMEDLGVPPIPEFIELVSDSGAGLYACKASVETDQLGRHRGPLTLEPDLQQRGLRVGEHDVLMGLAASTALREAADRLKQELMASRVDSDAATHPPAALASCSTRA
jgi:peroxiredoxin family protein